MIKINLLEQLPLHQAGAGLGMKQSIITNNSEEQVTKTPEFKCFYKTFTKCFCNYYEYGSIIHEMIGGKNTNNYYLKR